MIVIAVALACSLAGAAIAWPVAIGLAAPLVFGVPHLVAEAEVLWRRPRWALSREARDAIVLGTIALVALAVLGLRGRSLPAATIVVGGGTIALCALTAAGAAWRRAAVAASALALTLAALPWSRAVVASFAFGHSIVAVLVAAAVARGGARVLALIAPLVAVAAALAFAGDRWLAVLVVLQLAHYAAWLWWIPRAWARSPWPPWPIAAAAAATVVVLLVAGARAPAGTRDVYLALASFHGWIELALLARRAASSSSPSSSSSSSLRSSSRVAGA